MSNKKLYIHAKTTKPIKTKVVITLSHKTKKKKKDMLLAKECIFWN